MLLFCRGCNKTFVLFAETQDSYIEKTALGGHYHPKVDCDEYRETR
jgi:hypothetical protein